MNKEIEIITIKSLSNNYIWLLRNNIKNLTAVIDPGESEPVNRVLFQKNWSLDQIINTHHHYDHTNGNLELKKKWGAKLTAPEEEKNKIKNVDIGVIDNNEIEIAGLKARVIHTPGHTLGHVMFYLKKEKILFAGDTIFSLGCGRVFEGSMKDMFFSLNKIKSLDPETSIYCGHEYTENNLKFALEVDKQNEDLKIFSEKITDLKRSNLPTIPSLLKDELNCNPFLRATTCEIKTAVNMENDSNENVFAELRRRRDSF